MSTEAVPSMNTAVNPPVDASYVETRPNGEEAQRADSGLWRRALQRSRSPGRLPRAGSAETAVNPPVDATYVETRPDGEEAQRADSGLWRRASPRFGLPGCPLGGLGLINMVVVIMALAVVVLVVVLVLVYLIQDNFFNVLTPGIEQAYTDVKGGIVSVYNGLLHVGGKLCFYVPQEIHQQLTDFRNGKHIQRGSVDHRVKLWTEVIDLDKLVMLVEGGNYAALARSNFVQAVREFRHAQDSDGHQYDVWKNWTVTPDSTTIKTGRIGIIKGRKGVNVFMGYKEASVEIRYNICLVRCVVSLDGETQQFLERLFQYEILDEAQNEFPKQIEVKNRSKDEEL